MEAGKGQGTEHGRARRLLQIVREIRRDPKRPIAGLWASLGIGKTQFYKDKAELEKLGFSFDYSSARGFSIREDRLTPLTGLSLSDRVVLMFALQSLSGCGEGSLAAMALGVARKLAGGLASPFREQFEECFDHEITSGSFGVKPDIWEDLQKAVAEGRHVEILYQSASGDWQTRWRPVYPRRLYFRLRTLYLYARDLETKPPMWKVFRLSRVKGLRFTGVCQPWRPGEDDGFMVRQRNAFLTILGETAHEIKIRFTGDAARYALEQKWHESQRVTRESPDSVVLTFSVADPDEVIRWARQFGDGVEVVE